MKEITNARDLEQYGITRLTGEACPYSMRVLCDLDQRGRDFVESFFSCKQPYEAWKGGVASVMLPHSCWNDLAAFCLLMDGCELVAQVKLPGRDPYIVGGAAEEVNAYLNEYGSDIPPRDIRRFAPIGGGQATVRGRCVHTMSGRVE